MPDQEATAREEQFLGALLGMAIGDALGSQARDQQGSAQTGPQLTYAPTEGSDGNPSELGEISDRSEMVLCIVESMTTNGGRLDPANINARFGYLAGGPSREGLSSATLQGIAIAESNAGLVPDDLESPSELAIGVRGIPVGLAHALGGRNDQAFQQDVHTVTRLSHGGAVPATVVEAVARAIERAGRGRPLTTDVLPDVDPDLAFALTSAAKDQSFVDAMAAILGRGGETQTLGAIGGAVAGTRLGASGLPQSLIDGLDARIYLTMAAPWFYRAARLRAGTVIDLRQVT